MSTKRAWEAYPLAYRAQEVEMLCCWTCAGESGVLIGLPGVGKSNLLGFLCHRPDVIAHYCASSSFAIAPVLIDLNTLPCYDLSACCRVILRALYEARLQLAALNSVLFDALKDLYGQIEEKNDPFVLQNVLHRAISVFQEHHVRLMLVFDPFDQFCYSASPVVLNNLRGLRDSFKSTISYIVGLRREPAAVRDLAEWNELSELLDTHHCWLGSMNRADARWVIEQVEAGLEWTFSETQVDHLITLTGGYPALLRTASLWLAQTSSIPDFADWKESLLAAPGVQNRLADVWQGLSSQEQAVLLALSRTLTVASAQSRNKNIAQIRTRYESALLSLQQRRLCAETGSGWAFFSPLFASFVADLCQVDSDCLWYDPPTNRFFRGDQELRDLSEQDRRLLSYFLRCPPGIHTFNALIQGVWSQDDSSGVSNQAVQQAIHHLRGQIELDPAQPRYLLTERGIGYRFSCQGMAKP